MTDTMKTVPILLLLCLSTLSFCTTKPGEPQGPGLPGLDTPVAETVPEAAPPLIETRYRKGTALRPAYVGRYLPIQGYNAGIPMG